MRRLGCRTFGIATGAAGPTPTRQGVNVLGVAAGAADAPRRICPFDRSRGITGFPAHPADAPKGFCFKTS
jgi:hypothetical protein